jgi:[acyl-carrier-protein] S-malonyltransferase
MLTDWLQLPGAESFFRWAGAIAGADLLTLGTTGDAEAIKDTAVTQPLVVAMSLFIARELDGLPGPVNHTPHAGRDVVIAGHSVGELTAAALAGVLSVEAAIALTAVRGRAMAAACAQTPTGMSAVLGGDPDEVLAAIDKHGLTPANMNGAGQIVAAGALDGLEALKSDPPAKARIMPLSVAGAFHTAYMAPAREELEGLVGGLRPAEPSRLLLSNADGAGVTTGGEVLSRLVSQVTSPVRFDACLATMRELGVTAVLELPPAGALAGLAKREWKGAGIEILALSGPADLDRARELIAAERGRAEAEHLPDWRVVVAPARGTISPAEVAEGTSLPAGTRLASISSRRDEVHVSAAYDGVLAEWLVQQGDLVDAGDPIARLYPEVSA